jgi:DNA-binding cell septation regulator SpoVG
MLNIIYKEGNSNKNVSYIIFPDLNLGLDGGYISERTNNESLELRKLKLLVTGFISKSYVSSYNSYDGKVKQILEIFIKNNKLVNKVIENKNIYYNNDIKKNIFKNYYKDISFKITEDCKNKISKRLFEIFIANRNKNIDIIDFIKLCYKRLFNYFDVENNIFFYYNNKINLNIFKVINTKKIVYSIQIFDKMIKLVTKIVLINSKYFFLNNIKYNYTLLKFCDKTMKLVNSILLFCLLCDINIPYYCFHSDLSIAGNCRMCLVQLDTSLKPIASCAVSISINSTIYTNTKVIQKAREGVLEFLLINHPLDCPICDQGGECDLQEQFITYGNDRGRFLKRMI